MILRVTFYPWWTDYYIRKTTREDIVSFSFSRITIGYTCLIAKVNHRMEKSRRILQGTGAKNLL